MSEYLSKGTLVSGKMKCPACDGFGGWIDGSGPNAEPMMCEVCAGSGEVPDQSIESEEERETFHKLLELAGLEGLENDRMRDVRV